ncbi:hypothetical protein POVWA1_038360 [Plasmodium ovale wallikeri]|uniref:Uncharacterized protein n=1 Tax=Plasmodium ovale wallikeri TaxID=864142 RepID=A0A1A8Z412_PLAOA|nr:hypothetical protein POVWA1_038360 [Plasmodium ovale wallikeri]
MRARAGSSMYTTVTHMADCATAHTGGQKEITSADSLFCHYHIYLSLLYHYISASAHQCISASVQHYIGKLANQQIGKSASRQIGKSANRQISTL